MHANRFFTLAAIMALVAVLALAFPAARTTSAGALAPQALEAQRLERSQAADTARWNAMSDHYKRLDGAQSIERSRQAEAARWTAMAEYYQALQASLLQRGRAADAARWNAMAHYYQQKAQQ